MVRLSNHERFFHRLSVLRSCLSASWRELRIAPCLGEESFVDDYRERVNKERRIEGRGIELISLERLATLLKAKVPLEMLRSPTQARKVTAARRKFMLGAVKMDHRPSLIAAFLRCSDLVKGQGPIGNAAIANSGTQGHCGQTTICARRRKDGSPTVVDCCFPPLLTVGHFKDHSAEPLSAITG